MPGPINKRGLVRIYFSVYICIDDKKKIVEFLSKQIMPHEKFYMDVLGGPRHRLQFAKELLIPSRPALRKHIGLMMSSHPSESFLLHIGAWKCNFPPF